IESGQFTLNMTEYAIESVVETVRAATESLAQNKKLTLTTSVEKSLPVGLGDEQRLTQVLLNLVGNAIKFTDTGEVSIAAGARDGRFAVSVTDTEYHSTNRIGSSSSSIRSTAPTPRPRAARALGSPSPSRSWRCTAAASGYSRRRAKARRFRWSSPRGPSFTRRRHEARQKYRSYLPETAREVYPKN